jgi:hypothetical protein
MTKAEMDSRKTVATEKNSPIAKESKVDTQQNGEAQPRKSTAQKHAGTDQEKSK